MRVTFYSNFLNHHQLPFSLAMKDRVDDYTFIATEPTPQERRDMGYADMNHHYPFVLTTYDSEENKAKSYELAMDSDIVILGSAPDAYIVPRLKSKKLTFKYSERLYRKDKLLKKFPRHLIGAWLHHGRFQKYPLYMLCASSYTAADCARFHNYVGRTYKWGYFPEVKKQNLDELFALKRVNKKASILWAGRHIELKHPDASILLAVELKKRGYCFELNIIGNGNLTLQLKEMVMDNHLDDCVNMLGAMAPEKVRKYMEAADIFLFTSDFQEGWGAVLNESMNSGCAVVASHAIGSVPFLIKDGENGLIYENGNQEQLTQKVEFLLKDAAFRERMGRAAYQTLYDEWNAGTAAERVLLLVERLQNGKDTPFMTGPCSRAEILENGWYKSGK